MTEEAALYLEKARWHLANARIIFVNKIPEVAAREAYYAAFQAAEADIFERTGKIAKSHRGVHSEFSRLAKSEAGTDQRFLSFLGQAYSFKSISDYEVGLNARISAKVADDIIYSAEEFVSWIILLLNFDPVAPPPVRRL